MEFHSYGGCMTNIYDRLAKKSLRTGSVSDAEILSVLKSPNRDLLLLLHSSYAVRSKYFGNKVRIHILNNVRSGNCQEDCRYCGQSGASGNRETAHPMKEQASLLEAADHAAKAGAYRYCMAFSGRKIPGPDLEFAADTVRKIRLKHPALRLCVSAGFLDTQSAKLLKKAGVDRYNHNLNTSGNRYKAICTTHTYDDRLKTLKTAVSAGLGVCSGIIIGLGESSKDIVRMCRDLAEVKAKSVPVNFFIPVKGHRIEKPGRLSPEVCLKILCAFRFALPAAEIRAAAGREHHLRSLQALSLYPANSLFANGYLTAGGDDIESTKQMIEDAGFTAESAE